MMEWVWPRLWDLRKNSKTFKYKSIFIYKDIDTFIYNLFLII